MKNRRNILAISMLVLSFAAFAAPVERVEIEELPTKQVLQYEEVSNGEYQMVKPFSKKISIGFDKGHRIYGSTSLNRFWGDAKVEDGKIKVEHLEKTEARGKQSDRITEVKYLTILGDVSEIYFEKDQLILETPFKEKLIFKKKS